VTGAVTTHIMPYLSSVGISRTFSSMVVLAMALVCTSGRLGSGWLGDKLDTKKVYMLILMLTAVGMLVFAYVTPNQLWLIVIFVIFFGLGWAGFSTLRPVLLRKYFHSGKFGSILGIADALYMLGQLGIPLAGLAYDSWHSYQGIWLIYAGVAVGGLIILAATPDSLKTRNGRSKEAKVTLE
jgi:MFS transporter, OFA family, oxalate/formate antiporter